MNKFISVRAVLSHLRVATWQVQRSTNTRMRLGIGGVYKGSTFSKCRSGFSKCRSIFSKCRSGFSKYRSGFTKCVVGIY